MKIVWNDVDSPTVVLGNAALLKSLSVLVETEEDEICAEDGDCATVQCEIPNEEKMLKTTPPDDGDAPDDSNMHGSSDGNNDESNVEPNENEVSEQSTEKHEEGKDKMEQETESQPQSLADVRDEPIDTNAINSSEARKKSLVKMKIPPIWTPCDRRTNSALIYLYFRSVSVVDASFLYSI